MFKTDKQLHILCSAALTVVFGAPVALAIGTVVEYWDYKTYNASREAVAGDMTANVVGVAVGSLIKKLK